jgi:hypothetical protein
MLTKLGKTMQIASQHLITVKGKQKIVLNGQIELLLKNENTEMFC